MDERMKNIINLKKETRRRRKKREVQAFKDYLYGGIIKKFGAIPIELQEQVDKKIIEEADSYFGKLNG